jgi:hypothetical protein
LGGPQNQSEQRGEEKNLADPSAVQPVARRHTDCNIPAPTLKVAKDIDIGVYWFSVTPTMQEVQTELYWLSLKMTGMLYKIYI